LAGQRAGEQAAVPLRKQLAAVERHAGWRDRRHPVFHWLLHAVPGGGLMDLRAGIVDAETDHRPAVIPALADDIDLVAAARTVLDFPKLAVCRVDRKSLFVAMTIAPDFRLGAVAADEGIVGRRRTIGRDADHLAEMVGKVLRLVAVAEMFTQRDEQIAVAGMPDAA